MDALYFLGGFPRLSESFVLNEIHGLEERGHDVAVFARNRPNQPIRHDEYDGLDVPTHYADRPSVSDLPDLLSPEVLNPRVLSECLYPARPKYHAGFLHLAKQCINYVESLDREIDHVHAHFARQDKIAAAYVAAYYGVSCTVTAHAAEIYADPDPRMLQVLFDRIDRAIVPSEYNRGYLRDLLDLRTPVDIVPATTRVSKFEPTDGESPRRLLTIARFVEKKGIRYAIEAVAQLRETYPDIEHRIIGSGERKGDLKRRVAELGIEGNVTFCGHVSDERLHRELDAAAVFVLPCVVAANGDRDGSPVALKESMAMETPCVSTTVTGIPEMIEDGADGLLVETRDAGALADAIAALLGDETRREEMGRHARETVAAEFSLEVATEKLLSSFRKAGA